MNCTQAYLFCIFVECNNLVPSKSQRSNKVREISEGITKKNVCGCTWQESYFDTLHHILMVQKLTGTIGAVLLLYKLYWHLSRLGDKV